MRIEVSNPEAVAREAFYLAWLACDPPMGMGVFRDRPGATRDEVWDNAHRMGDYPDALTKSDAPGDVHGDYVFGRMMKLSLQWDAAGVEFADGTPRQAYQSWCSTYPTYESLVRAAVASLAKEATA